MMESWFVVQTKSNAEIKAVFHLRNQGIETFLPRYRKETRHARKKQISLRPLFPGYLFVKFDTEAAKWRSINGTVGVISILQMGDEPRPVADEIVESFLDNTDADGVTNLLYENIKIGDPVRMTDGPFIDYEGLLEEKDDQQRVVLLLSLMGRQMRVHASMDHLVAVS